MNHRVLPLAVLSIFATGCAPAGDAPEAAAEDPRAQLLARAAALELPGEYVLPPGDALVHSTAGFAKILCSNVFLSGLDPDFAAEHTGFFSAPAQYRGAVTDRVVDYENQRVHLTLPDGTVRSAKLHGDQGCLAPPHRRGRAVLRDRRGHISPARRRDHALAAGRPAPGRALSGRRGHGQGGAGGGGGLRAPGRADRRLRGHPPGPPAGGALPRGHRPHHPAGKLVHEQEPHRHPHGHPGSEGGLRPVAIRAHSGVAIRGRPAPGDPHRRHHEDVIRAAVPEPGRSGRRPEHRIPRPPVPVYGHRQLVRVGGREGPAMGARYGGTVSELRPRAHQLPGPPGRRGAAGRELPSVPAAASVRQAGDAQLRRHDRSLRKLPAPGVRLRQRGATGRGWATSISRTAW